MPSRPREPFLEYIEILHDRFPLEAAYAGQLPAVKATKRLKLHPKATFFIGENGTGKSTLLEAIAVAEGFNPEGGTRNFNFATRRHADRYKWIRLGRGVRANAAMTGSSCGPKASITWPPRSNGWGCLTFTANRTTGNRTARPS